MDEMIDKELRDVGVKFIDHTREEPMDAMFEEAEEDSGTLVNILASIKFPALFLALTIGIGVCEYLGLMAEIIAVPGMCVCAACFGGNLKK